MQSNRGKHTFTRDGVEVTLLYDDNDPLHFGVSFDGGLPQHFVSVDVRQAYIDWRFNIKGWKHEPTHIAALQSVADVLQTGVILCDGCGQPHTNSMRNLCYKCRNLPDTDSVLTGRGGVSYRPTDLQ